MKLKHLDGFYGNGVHVSLERGELCQSFAQLWNRLLQNSCLSVGKYKRGILLIATKLIVNHVSLLVEINFQPHPRVPQNFSHDFQLFSAFLILFNLSGIC